MSIGSEPIVARFGRHRMGFSWNCAVNSTGSGSRAQAVERRTQKAEATCHYLCLNRPELIIYANKSLHCSCACEQIAGYIRLEYPQDPDCVSARRPSTAGFTLPHNLTIPAIAICAVPTGAAGGKSDMARADAFPPGVLLSASDRSLLLTEPGATQRPIWPVPPGARRLPRSMRRSFLVCAALPDPYGRL